MIPVQQLEKVIAESQLRWVPREVPSTEVHALGWEPSKPDAIEQARKAAARFRAARLPALKAVDGQLGIATSPPHPASFDWRTRGVIGGVRDQEYCGSCVSFATTGLVGAMVDIELGANAMWLSEADQHFASAHGANCGGWNNLDSLDEVRRRGIATERLFPYDSAFDQPPQIDSSTNLWAAHARPETFRDINTYGITDITAWTGDDRKYYLATVGPLICGFTVYDDFNNYGGGVYRHVTGQVDGGHAVLVVGYSDIEQAWICRNSWGTSFGGPARADGTGAGYFMLAYGDSNIDGEPFYGCHGVVPPTGRLHLGLASVGNELLATWKGEYGDDRLFYSTFDGTSWTGQLNEPNVGSNVGPTATPFNNRAFAAWKGAGTDQGLYWSTFDGAGWAPQQNIPGVGSSIGPSVAAFNGRLFAAWKGINNDQGIYWSSFDGTTWAPQLLLPGVASSTGPSLAEYGGRLYAAWKGMDNDQGIYWSSFDGATWAPQQLLPGVASSLGPSLATVGGRLYAAWKGMADDQGIYWSSFDGTTWAPQQLLPGVASSIGPSLAGYGGRLYAAWKGMDNDQGIYWSSFDGTQWSPQSTIPGNTCPD
jgi:hypothetical protein